MSVPFEVTDTSLIASAWKDQERNELRLVKSGGDTDIAWSRANIAFDSGTDEVCVFDEGGGNCDQTDLCAAGSTLADVDVTATFFKPPQDKELPLTKNLDFRLEALEDYNGDGKADILLRKNLGRWFIHLMDGTEVIDQGSPILTKNPDLHFAASADFSGDGKADLLLRHTSGRWFLYELDGLEVIDSGSPSLNKNPAFSIVEIADFNLDGKQDILMRRADGPWVIYLMDGVQVLDRGWPEMVKSTLWEPIVD